MANNYSNFEIIRVTPTLDTTGAYTDEDVYFTATEIPNAVLGKGGCSKIIAAYILNQDRDTLKFQAIYTQANTAIGTIHATADISDANLEAIGFCGAHYFDNTVSTISALDNVKITQGMALSAQGEVPAPILIQAEPDSTSVYVSGVLDGSTPTHAAADDLDLILHIEK
tara:strand:- start:58 stop:564 length:507 start_codon:yes stop_codon:yes gene_type:complete